MSYFCSRDGGVHSAAPCPYCVQDLGAANAIDTSKITFTKEQAIDLAIETWKAREVCWNREREQLRSKLSAVEKERDLLAGCCAHDHEGIELHYRGQLDSLKAKLAVVEKYLIEGSKNGVFWREEALKAINKDS